MDTAGKETIRIKYHSDQVDKLDYIEGKSDWIDLRSAQEVTMQKGDFCLIDLGVSVQLPKGYEMLIAARSSTFKNYGLIQTNAVGVVDESYCSDEDHLKWPCYATRDTTVHVNDRICQFRILRHQPEICFEEVETLGNKTRGGFGSTGIQ